MPNGRKSLLSSIRLWRHVSFFRRSIALLQMQKHIADSYAEYMAGKHYVYGVAANLDLSSTGNGLDADGTKLYCTTMAKNVADRAMQVSSGSHEVHVPCTVEVERIERPLPFAELGQQSLPAWCDAGLVVLCHLDCIVSPWRCGGYVFSSFRNASH